VLRYDRKASARSVANRSITCSMFSWNSMARESEFSANASLRICTAAHQLHRIRLPMTFAVTHRHFSPWRRRNRSRRQRGGDDDGGTHRTAGDVLSDRRETSSSAVSMNTGPAPCDNKLPANQQSITLLRPPAVDERTRGGEAMDALGSHDERRSRGRPSRVVLIPRRWDQACG
jgi:hypothetical protein